VKPFRGKRRGPQSLPVGFNRSAACRRRRRIRKGRGGDRMRGRTVHFRRAERHDRFVGGQKPPGKVAAVARLRCYRPGRRWPVGGPRKTASAAGRETAAPCVRSICGDCRQCPLTAGVRRLRVVSRPAWGRWRIGRSPVRPVLKHGPRSLTCARVSGCYET
jgi:hypothetical protein